MTAVETAMAPATAIEATGATETEAATGTGDVRAHPMVGAAAAPGETTVR